MSGQSVLAQTLMCAESVFDAVLRGQSLAIEGREKEARMMFRGAAVIAERELAILKGVIAAQAEAANLMKLSQTEAPRLICGAFFGKAAPDPNASNAHPTDPIQPTAEA